MAAPAMQCERRVSQITPDGRDSVTFWGLMMAIGPLAAAIIPPTAVWLLGGLEDFAWVGQEVTAAQAFAIIGAMAFPFAAFFFAQDMFNRARARTSRFWPTVPGVVQSSEVRERRTRLGTNYRLALRYSYEVGGSGYEGDRVAFGPSWVPDEDLIDALARKYPAGAAVAVHVDPAAAETAVLETTTAMAFKNQIKIWLLAAFPLVLTIAVAVRPLIHSD